LEDHQAPPPRPETSSQEAVAGWESISDSRALEPKTPPGVAIPSRQKGGRFIAVVPDSEAMLEGYAHGEISFAELREVTFGGQEYDGDFHFNMYSKESLVALLTDAGFNNAAITASARRNGLCYEMQVEARQPDGTGDPAT